MRIIPKTLVLLVVLALLVMPAFAQDDMAANAVVANDQFLVDNTITAASVTSEVDGWLVVHADADGGPGPVLGQTLVPAGDSENVVVALEGDITQVLWPMLHVDTGEAGAYEFGAVEGADGPVIVDGAVLTFPIWTVPHVRFSEQVVSDMGAVTAESVLAAEDGWLVIHSEADGGPGPVLGQTLVSAGLNEDVSVELNADGLTNVLWPMLHVDTGEAGVYEFGAVEGADGPVFVNDAVLTFAVRTDPHIHADPQIVTADSPSFVAERVLSAGEGWLVIHSEADGGPGPVLGQTLVGPGINADVVVDLDAEGLTNVLWPMLHVDTGEMGVYEFGAVEGADGPVIVDGNVVTFGVDVASSITYEGTLDGNVITVAEALIDADGWMVIHADADGAPGPVLGQTAISAGFNENIAVELSEDGMTETVFPMLHYDTGEIGVYEFGAVEGADGPVAVDGNVVTGPLLPESAME